MRQRIINSIIALSSIVLLASCGGMDAPYQEFLEGGPIVYVGRVDSLTAYAGRNRAMVEWDKLLDPRATTAKIFWENRTKSMEVKLTAKDEKTQVVIPDLKETSYVFEVCTYDDHGHSSIMSEVPCTVYGSSYESWLYTVRVSSAKLTGTSLAVTFAKAQDETFIGSEISYTATDGTAKTLMVKAPTVSATIPDFSGTAFTYRSVYLPESTAIDTFYSAAIERAL